VTALGYHAVGIEPVMRPFLVSSTTTSSLPAPVT